MDKQIRFRAAEAVFKPEIIWSEDNQTQSKFNCKEGLVEMMMDSIQKCDSDMKEALLENMVLAGGTTMMPGFQERVEQDFCKIFN